MAKFKADYYMFPKPYVGELRGQKFYFWSCYRPNTSGLFIDAVSACKDAGLYTGEDDAAEILVDGERFNY